VVALKSGTTTLRSASSTAASFNVAATTLPTTGTYTVAIDPSVALTGGLSIRVTNP
jgi:chitodextrinase